MTIEARAHIKQAEKVLFLVFDPITADWIKDINPSAESLYPCYQPGESRMIAYEGMIDRILCEVRKGLRVCAAFYGHPGVFVYPSHEAIKQARIEGYSAKMLPGISAEDCLFADLGVDPARTGCQSFEATDFLVHGRSIDSTAALVLWQIGTVGSSVAAEGARPTGLAVLVERLLEHYPGEHEVTVYEASAYPGFKPLARTVRLDELSPEHVTAMATLYVPPSG